MKGQEAGAGAWKGVGIGVGAGAERMEKFSEMSRDDGSIGGLSLNGSHREGVEKHFFTRRNALTRKKERATSYKSEGRCQNKEIPFLCINFYENNLSSLKAAILS